MQITKITGFLLVLTILLLASLSCNLTRIGELQPESSLTEIPISTQAVLEFTEEVQSVIETMQSGGPINMEITEEQLTSLAATGLGGQGDQVIRDVQVRLQNGQAQITGNVTQGGMNLPLNIILEIMIDSAGQPYSKVISATVGPFPLPQDVQDQIKSEFDQAMRTQFNTEEMFIESIVIADGRITISGRTR